MPPAQAIGRGFSHLQRRKLRAPPTPHSDAERRSSLVACCLKYSCLTHFCHVVLGTPTQAQRVAYNFVLACPPCSAYNIMRKARSTGSHKSKCYSRLTRFMEYCRTFRPSAQNGLNEVLGGEGLPEAGTSASKCDALSPETKVAGVAAPSIAATRACKLDMAFAQKLAWWDVTFTAISNHTEGKLDKLGWIVLKTVSTHFCVKVAFFCCHKGKNREKGILCTR
jgi:hypothetical protein